MNHSLVIVDWILDCYSCWTGWPYHRRYWLLAKCYLGSSISFFLMNKRIKKRQKERISTSLYRHAIAIVCLPTIS